MTFGSRAIPAARRNENEFPHIVEMPLPSEGFDYRLRRQMEEFHSSRKIKARFGVRSRHRGQEYCRWCFADQKYADEFQERFGGKRLTAKTSMEPAHAFRQ